MSESKYYSHGVLMYLENFVLQGPAVLFVGGFLSLLGNALSTPAPCAALEDLWCMDDLQVSACKYRNYEDLFDLCH